MRRTPRVPSRSRSTQAVSTASKPSWRECVLFFVAFSRTIVDQLGLEPYFFLHELRLWRPVTMFLHAGLHILVNARTMADRHRAGGSRTRAFVKFYFARASAPACSRCCFPIAVRFRPTGIRVNVIGVGAIYGLCSRTRCIFRIGRLHVSCFRFLRALRLILGAIAFYSSLGSGGVANYASQGLIVVRSQSSRIHPLSELKYRHLKWKDQPGATNSRLSGGRK
jgi:hypothetical protein